MWIQLVVGLAILIYNRAFVPKTFWYMESRDRYLVKGEEDILIGVSDETPKGVSPHKIWNNIVLLRHRSLGIGVGLGLIVTPIIWLCDYYTYKR